YTTLFRSPNSTTGPGHAQRCPCDWAANNQVKFTDDMKRLTAAEIATALSGELYGIDPETPLTAGVVTDSREVGPGDIYVARRGESFDGIEFAASAVEAGAALIIGESVPTLDDEPLPVVVVADATEALGQLAKHSIEGLRADGELTVIAITGSVGKTTVKDLAADLLSGEA